MLHDILDILIGSAEDAFLQVGVFVAAVLLIFGYINYKTQGRLVGLLEKSKRLQPILGALLGLTPGCGGAIFVMPLYLKGTVTFGTVVATLTATMGDAAFVMISTRPTEYLIVSAISFAAAIITGYTVDALKLDGGFKKRRTAILNHAVMPKAIHDSIDDHQVHHIGHEEGDSIDVLMHHQHKSHRQRSWVYRFTHHAAYKVFWIVSAIGLVLGMLLLFQVDINKALGIPHLGTIVGIGGTLFALFYMIVSKKLFKNEEHEEAEEKLYSLKETLIHNAEDTAFVCVWVFAAYFAYELFVLLVGGEALVQSWMLTSGVLSVVVGAVIGLIPGCGPQIIFMSLYVKGMLPFAAIVANAISQDGDALFPLLVIDRRSSLQATIVTTIPALLIGLIVYFLMNGWA